MNREELKPMAVEKLIAILQNSDTKEQDAVVKMAFVDHDNNVKLRNINSIRVSQNNIILCDNTDFGDIV